MAAGAEATSELADRFSNWMLGGFGAALALILANLDKLSSTIPIADVRRAGEIYVAAAALGVIEKLLALWAGGMAKGFTAGLELGKGVDPKNFDIDVYHESARKGFLRMGRWFLDRQIAALARGDITFVPRMALKAAQAQGALALIEAVLVVIAAAVIISSL